MRENIILSKTPFDKEKTIKKIEEIGNLLGMDIRYHPNAAEKYMDLDLNKNYNDNDFDFLGVHILTEEELLQNPIKINDDTYHISITIDYSMINTGKEIHHFPFLFKFMKSFIEYSSDFFYASETLDEFFTPKDILNEKVGWLKE